MTLQYFFNLYLVTSIKGSLLVLLTIIIQRYFKKDFTSKWIYLLWCLVIFRFLVPNMPIVNVLSLYNLGLYKRISFSISDLILGRSAITNVTFDFTGDIHNIEPFISKTLSFDFTKFASNIWLIGILILLLLFILLHLVFIKYMRNNHLYNGSEIKDLVKECCIKLRIKKTPNVYISKQIKTPITYGIIKPKIIIPKYLHEQFNKEEIKYILLHELTHIKHRDNLYSFISTITCIMHWFNPLIWYVYFKMKRDCELACDENVLTILTSEEYKQYGSALISVMEKSTSFTQQPVLVKAFINDRTEANSRIMQIVKFKPKRKFVLVISSCLLILVALIGFNEDLSTRSAVMYSNYELPDYLNMTADQIRSTFKVNPVHDYFIRTERSPYFVIYYNIRGTKHQFWFDKPYYVHSEIPLEITTTSFKNIKQGMKTEAALKIAKNEFSDLLQKKTTDMLEKYVFKYEDYHIMIISDITSQKVYSITIY